jgi:outer membrane protein assembly factor BamB
MLVRTRVGAASLACFVAGATGALWAQDYPQWRGRDRNGDAIGFRVPDSWPGALTRRWRVEVGEGYAAPLVVGDTVFVFARRGDEEVLAALEAATGAERWRSGYRAPYRPTKSTIAHGSGPKATPLFHEGRLFTQGVSGIVAGFDARTGKLLWRTREPREHPIFSAASSPLGVGGLVIVHPGNYGPLTAFDAANGRVRWTAGTGGLFASPFLATIDGVAQVVTSTQDAIIGVVPETGRVLWQFPWPDRAGAVTPLLSGDTIVISAFDAGIAAFKPSRRGGKWTADPLWRIRDVSLYMSNPVAIGETLYGFSHRASGQYFALDLATGKVLWLGPPRAGENAAFAKAGDLLVILRDDAQLVIARDSRTALAPIASYTVADSATWAQPVLSADRILIKDVSGLTMWETVVSR